MSLLNQIKFTYRELKFGLLVETLVSSQEVEDNEKGNWDYNIYILKLHCHCRSTYQLLFCYMYMYKCYS